VTQRPKHPPDQALPGALFSGAGRITLPATTWQSFWHLNLINPFPSTSRKICPNSREKNGLTCLAEYLGHRSVY